MATSSVAEVQVTKGRFRDDLLVAVRNAAIDHLRQTRRSITHGASASRPGMTQSAILGRRFHQPVIHFEFSRNGRLDPEVVDPLAELDPAASVWQCPSGVDLPYASCSLGGPGTGICSNSAWPRRTPMWHFQ